MTMRRLLVSAYGCEPGKGSEQGVGWHWVLQLARIAEVVVVTRSNNRSAIEAALPPELATRVHFIYHDLPVCLRRFKQRERGLYLYYLLWQWGAYRIARREIARRPVDAAIHLTFGSIWLPTFLHLLPVPFIWGPLGGGEAVPWPLIRTLPWAGRWIQYSRYLLIATLRCNPIFRVAAGRASAILVRTNDTALAIPRHFRAKTRVVLETAAADEWFGSPTANERPDACAGGEVRAIYTGRLVPFKNLPMALRAVATARARGAPVRLDLVGDGPLAVPLARMVEALGLTGAVTFVGSKSQAEVLAALAASDLYLFPSLREGGSWSLMEAMAAGLPIVCVNTSGMAVIADTSSARMIEPADVDEMTERFAEALCELAADRGLRQRMGAAARARIQSEFRWDQKANFMASLVKEIEASRG